MLTWFVVFLAFLRELARKEGVELMARWHSKRSKSALDGRQVICLIIQPSL